VLGFGLVDQGSSPGRGWKFFSPSPSPNRFWGPPSLVLGALLQGVKRPGREADHSPPSPRMRGAIHPLPHYTFMVWCSEEMHRDNFTLPYTRMLTVYQEGVTFEVLPFGSYILSPMMLPLFGNIFGTLFMEQLSVPLSLFFFFIFGCLQYPEKFATLSQT
jgi:hypothetical protein